MSLRSILPCVFCAIVGLAAGWLAGFQDTPILQAKEGDRSGQEILATGPVSVRLDPATRMPVTQDAVYYLDYEGGRLLATVPQRQQTTAGTQVLGAFAVRDLVADFRPPRGTTPRFLMAVGRLGEIGGWAPLFVFETTTGQVATYRVEAQGTSIGGNRPPRFELVEMHKLP